jgi:uncharacterized membrane protein
VAEKTGEQIVFGILSYLGILVLIPLLLKKDDAWVKEHAKQGLAYLILGVVVWIVAVVLMFIPVIGWAISMILWLLMVVIFIVELIKVIQGNSPWEIPVLGAMAKGWNI